jgi:glycosyltransferase involved in cell wall biosynthesis
MLSARVCLLGAIPPPYTGAAAITQKVCELLRENGIVFDLISRANYSRYLDSLHFACNAIAALVFRRYSVAYASFAGGWGQLYWTLIFGVCRLRRIPVCIHHHSFSYCDRWWWLTALALRTAGPDALHVCLCGRMAELLEKRYGVKNRLILPNRTFFSLGSTDTQIRRPLTTVGYFSAVTKSKGAIEFLNLASQLRHEGLKFVIAGSVGDAELHAAVLHASHIVEYCGNLTGLPKKAFLEQLDVLLFPSNYVHEADPVSVQEALMHGVPVIYRSRGCLDELVGDAGVGVAPEANFLAQAISAIHDWQRDDASFQRARQLAYARSSSGARNNSGSLISWLAGGHG